MNGKRLRTQQEDTTVPVVPNGMFTKCPQCQKSIYTKDLGHDKICPECGRSYIAGGETTTQIKYYNESNPYQQNKKAEDSIKYQGLHVNQTL